MKKSRTFFLFNIKAKNSEEALLKARKKANSFGDTASAVRLVRSIKPKGKLKTYTVFGGKKK